MIVLSLSSLLSLVVFLRERLGYSGSPLGQASKLTRLYIGYIRLGSKGLHGTNTLA
jgi:hypothetical protein